MNFAIFGGMIIIVCKLSMFLLGWDAFTKESSMAGIQWSIAYVSWVLIIILVRAERI
jgi:hypothetical protein